MIPLKDPLVTQVESLMQNLVTEHGGPSLGPIALEHLQSGGKRIRARLALSAVQAWGGDVSKSVAWAAACELFHNGTLVHDDLQDGDQFRRGKITTWAKYGMPQSVNCGDLLILLPYMALQEMPVSNEMKWALSRLVAEKACSVIQGQAQEVQLTQEKKIDRDFYLATISGKTSGLFEMPVLGAALLSNKKSSSEPIVQCFRTLGLIFQIQDDILDLYGDKGRNDVGADIREGKVSALVLAHLLEYPEDRPWLLDILNKPGVDNTDDEIDTLKELFKRKGALTIVKTWLKEMTLDIQSSSHLKSQSSLNHLMNEALDTILLPIKSILDVKY